MLLRNSIATFRDSEPNGVAFIFHNLPLGYHLKIASLAPLSSHWDMLLYCNIFILFALCGPYVWI
jgi:hypothetical protein